MRQYPHITACWSGTFTKEINSLHKTFHSSLQSCLVKENIWLHLWVWLFFFMILTYCKSKLGKWLNWLTLVKFHQFLGSDSMRWRQMTMIFTGVEEYNRLNQKGDTTLSLCLQTWWRQESDSHSHAQRNCNLVEHSLLANRRGERSVVVLCNSHSDDLIKCATNNVLATTQNVFANMMLTCIHGHASRFTFNCS